MTMLRPLGHRLLVRPDPAPTHSEGGILIPDVYAVHPPMSGRVIRQGDGSKRDRELRRATIAHCLAILDEADKEAATGREAILIARDELRRYMARAERRHVCEVGDRVLFPMEAGHEIVLGERTEEAVVILDEDSVLAVVDNSAVVNNAAPVADPVADEVPA